MRLARYYFNSNLSVSATVPLFYSKILSSGTITTITYVLYSLKNGRTPEMTARVYNYAHRPNVE